MPLRLDNVVIIAPDGSKVAAQNAATGKYRSVFDLELKQQGTYRIGVVNNYVTGRWEEDGKPKRWRGTAETFANEVPKDAKDLKSASRSAASKPSSPTARPATPRSSPAASAWNWCR